MDYTVEIDRLALKTLKSLDKPTKQRISKKISSLAKNPYPPNAIKIQGQDAIWRLRDGNFRIAYTVKQNKLLVLVLYIGNRKDFYQNLKRIKF